jgi:hypothetical protein
MTSWNESSPAFPAPNNRRVQQIVEFWMEVDAFEAAGGNVWEALHALRDEVTSSLFEGDVANAESLTAQALFLLEASGW